MPSPGYPSADSCGGSMSYKMCHAVFRLAVHGFACFSVGHWGGSTSSQVSHSHTFLWFSVTSGVSQLYTGGGGVCVVPFVSLLIIRLALHCFRSHTLTYFGGCVSHRFSTAVHIVALLHLRFSLTLMCPKAAHQRSSVLSLLLYCFSLECFCIVSGVLFLFPGVGCGLVFFN